MLDLSCPSLFLAFLDTSKFFQCTPEDQFILRTKCENSNRLSTHDIESGHLHLGHRVEYH